MRVLVYGAYGYTGELIARTLAEGDGPPPMLAGRSRDKLAPLASKWALQHRVFGLEDPAAIREALQDVDVVMHTAGPFSKTAEPMAEACIQTKTHYLDITGEVDVFCNLRTMDERAKDAGVMLLPGIGFDVAPTDCLVAALFERMPEATALDVAIHPSPGISRGTATTAVEQMAAGGLIREHGSLRRVPPGSRKRKVEFGFGPVMAYMVPWGDLVTAHHSTGIPHIVTYTALPGALRVLLSLTRWFGPVLAKPQVERFLKDRIQARMAGPTREQRERWHSYGFAEVRDDTGRRLHGWVRCPEMYEFTRRSSVAAVQRVLAGQATPGFQTPATAFGSEFVTAIDGVHRHIGT